MMMTVRMSFPSKSKTLSSPRGEIRITFNDAASADMTAMMRSVATNSFIFSLVRSLNGLQRFKGLQGINQGGSANSSTYLCEVGLLTDEEPLADPCLFRSLGCVNNATDSPQDISCCPCYTSVGACMIHAAVHNPTITHPTHLVTHPATNPTITTPSTPLLPNHDQPTLLLPPDVVQPHFHGYQSAIFGPCEELDISNVLTSTPTVFLWIGVIKGKAIPT